MKFKKNGRVLDGFPNYKFIGKGEPNSYVNLQTDSMFITDIRAAYEKGTLKGPSWEAFRSALSTPENAAEFYILTARGQSSDAYYAGLKFLHEKGEIAYLPPIGHLIGVGGADFAGIETAVAKRLTLELIAESVEQNPLPVGEHFVVEFSDDYWSNILEMRQGIQSKLTAKHPNIAFYTLFTSPEPVPEGGVRDLSTRNGTSRRVQDSEYREIPGRIDCKHLLGAA